MTHVITSFCLHDGSCLEVCPTECIVPGKPVEEWPNYYIDPEACIDCGACAPECPYDAIFPEDEVPDAYTLSAEQEYYPHGGARTKAAGGEVLNLTEDIKPNYDFFSDGPGYDAQ